MQDIWNGKVSPTYGLGETRTLDEYKKTWNVDYINLKIGGDCIKESAQEDIKVDEQNKVCFTYPDGSTIENTGSFAWTEKTSAFECNFKEVSCCDNEWVLRDESRSVDMKVESDGKCWVKFPTVDWFLHKIAVYSKLTEPRENQNIVIPTHIVENSRICVITLGTPNMKDVLKHSMKNQKYYCKKHGYDFIHYDDSILPKKL